MREIALNDPAWSWDPGDIRSTEYAGRPCVAFGDAVDVLALPAGVSMIDGAIEVDVAVTGERAFHGVVWRVQDRANYESFYVRPHQVGNPDACQYNPVYHDVASWQLYHGEGYWAPIQFPIGEWFTIRAVFAGDRLEVFVGDRHRPALESRLLMPAVAGGAGLLIGGPGLFVSRFAVSAVSEQPPAFRGAGPPTILAVPGIVPACSVSDTFAEFDVAPTKLATDAFDGRVWARLEAEPSGTVYLAQVNGVAEDANTCWARAGIRSDRARTVAMPFGFSDRAVVYLNGRALYRGDDSYRSRDYRFLGSIGWYDTVFLPLVAGDNDLAIAVSEDFGGWGVRARFDDLDGLSFEA
jgi:hypothetical protein